MRRYPIPILKKGATKKASGAISWRSFPSGPENFIRQNRGESLTLAFKFRTSTGAQLATLHTNISGNWEDIPFLFDREREVWECQLPCSAIGLFRFRVKYSQNSGGRWRWDSVPYSSLWVDPGGPDGVRLYTLIPAASGTITDWIKLLPHILKLGFNTIHLLPITLQDSSNSPYAAKDLFEIDPRYLDSSLAHLSGWEQFEQFIATCQKLKIKLCLDLVLNHIGVNSRIVQQTADWIVADPTESDGLKRAGCFDQGQWHLWRDLVLLHYQHPKVPTRKALWHYMTDYALFWANYANLTGGMIRLDNLHSTDQKFLKSVLERVREEFPDLALYGEFFSDMESTQKFIFEYGIQLLLATPWTAPYAEQTRHFLNFVHTQAPQVSYLIPLNSHDSLSTIEEFGDIRATIPRYAIYALLGCGMTGICQGAEYGVNKKVEFIGDDLPLITTGQHESAPKLFAGFTAINQLLKEHPYLRSSGNLQFLDGEHGAVIAAKRFAAGENGSSMLLVANLDTSSYWKIEIPLSPDEYEEEFYWCEYLSKRRFLVKASTLKLKLAPCELVIFLSNR
jgi:hypothetical protein